MKTNHIYNYIERLSELLRVDARQAVGEYGLLPVQLEALHYLAICNQFSDTPMAVTEYLGQTKGTVSQTLKVLEKKGLLTKEPDVNDKRVAHLKLSKAGRDLVKSTIPTPMLARAFDGLDKDKQLQIEAALNHLLTTILQSNEMKSFGVCESCIHNSRNEAGEYYCNLVEQPLDKNDIIKICREHKSKV